MKRGGVFVGPFPTNMSEPKNAKELNKKALLAHYDEEDKAYYDDILEKLETPNNSSSYVTFARGNAVGLLTLKNIQQLIENEKGDPMINDGTPFHRSIINYVKKHGIKVPMSVKTLDDIDDEITEIMFTPPGSDNENIMVIKGKQYLQVLEKGRREWEVIEAISAENGLEQMCFTPDGNVLALYFKESNQIHISRIHILSLDYVNDPVTIIPMTDTVTHMAFMTDRYLLVGQQQNNGLRVIDIQNTTRTYTPRSFFFKNAYLAPPVSVSDPVVWFDYREDYIAMVLKSSSNYTYKVYLISVPVPVLDVTTVSTPLMTVSLDGSVVLMCVNDTTLLLYETRSGSLKASFTVSRAPMAMDISVDNTKFVVVYPEASNFDVFDIATGQYINYSVPDEIITSVKYSPDGDTLLMGTSKKHIKVWTL